MSLLYKDIIFGLFVIITTIIMSLICYNYSKYHDEVINCDYIEILLKHNLTK